jgi:hypothetical protein
MKKIEDWAATVEEENKEVADLIRNNIIVTGGAIASMLLREKVNDYDCYIRDFEAAQKIINFYTEKFKAKKHTTIEIDVMEDPVEQAIKLKIKSAGVIGEQSENYEYFESSENPPEDYLDTTMDIDVNNECTDRYEPKFLSQNAITLSNDIQIISRFIGEPEIIHENYDFIHATNYYTHWNKQLHLNQDALKSLLERNLYYVGSKYPLASIIRTRKFIQRGWTITAGQYLKMVMQLNKLDLLNYGVFIDQLNGVDVAYFQELMEILEEKFGATKQIDETYLATLMDRLL